MIPHLTCIRQPVASERVANPYDEVRSGLQALPLKEHVTQGMRIAVALGSRGISCLTTVVEAVLTELQALGARPFLVPAMGSHGGGNAAGQQHVLESYGLAETRTGIPILSSMDTVQVGVTASGMPVYFDAHAAAADGIIIINRVKEHTAFKAKWESGIMKMLAVGLGKAPGAVTIHNWGVRDAMPEAARLLLAKMPVIAGIAIVENGYHEPAQIAVLRAGEIETAEPPLLDLARKLMPKIPFEPIDLLIIEEMGKDISGTGIDLNVVGMWRRLGGPVEPEIATIAVLDLTKNSHGNAIGVGHADLITQRLRDKIDPVATYTNCLTSHNLAGGKIPITLASDLEVIKAGLAGLEPSEARVVLIRNTLELETMWVSNGVLQTVETEHDIEIVAHERPLKFDDTGALIRPL